MYTVDKLEPIGLWRRTPLFYVTILATLCIKGLKSSGNIIPQKKREERAGVYIAPLSVRDTRLRWTQDQPTRPDKCRPDMLAPVLQH